MVITQLNIDNRYLQALPCDPSANPSPRQVTHSAYSFVKPASCSAPKTIAFTKELALMLGFKQQDLGSPHFADLFTGNKLMPTMQAWATCYGGHQFGQWAGQLGDGRAMMLAEIATAQHGHYTLQLKGAGPTPYSRRADGFAVLRSSIREFLCSEAMFNLGVPTTRALSLCLTGDKALRDMFYDGNHQYEPTAVVCRVSKSFTRFGSFELPASRGDITLLNTLLDSCISLDFPELLTSGQAPQQRYLSWFQQVCNLTCQMIIHWMRIGFVHGVMNTDNMSIIGQTIDYGPYGWLDNYDPNWTPNTTDAEGRRYCFSAQGEVSQWNLWKLAQAIAPLIDDTSSLEAILKNYSQQYQQAWHNMMAKKLGLTASQPDDSNYIKEQQLFSDLEVLLSLVETDMTLFYRQLAKLNINQPLSTTDIRALFTDCYYQKQELTPEYDARLSAWLSHYIKRSQQENKLPSARALAMNAVNPKYILRNYLAQQAIKKAEHGDYSTLLELQQVLKKPYAEQPEFEAYAQKRPDWAKHSPACSMLSCSS